MSQLCADTDDNFHNHNDFVKVLLHMNAESIALGVMLAIGSVISVIPQHIKIWKTGSVVGLSFVWMFLGNINQFSSVTNAVVMKFPQIQACDFVGTEQCAPSLLTLVQLVILWMVSFPIYIWFLVFSSRKTLERREWLSSRILFVVLVVFILSMIGAAAIILMNFGDCDSITLGFAYFMGILSTVVTFIQWAPQIYSTYKTKSVGSFSILMLMIQAPGSMIILFFFIFISHESVSTWLSYVSAIIQQIILLIMLFYYDRKSKQQKKQLLNIQESEFLLADSED